MKSKKMFLSLTLLIFTGCATYNKNPTTTYESDEDASLSRIAGGDNKTKNIVVINSFKIRLMVNLWVGRGAKPIIQAQHIFVQV